MKVRLDHDKLKNEFYLNLINLGIFFTNIKDKEGRPVVWLRLSRYTNSDATKMIKKYSVFLFEKADRQTRDSKGWVL